MSDQTCDTTRELLQLEHYEGGLPPPVQAHLETCADCRSYRQQVQALSSVLAMDEDQGPRPGFDTRFFARLKEEKARRSGLFGWLTARSGRQWLVGAGAALSAAAVAAVLVVAMPSGDEPASMLEELELAMSLELVEEIDLLQQLDEVEAFEVLAQVDDRDLEQILREGVPQ